MLRKGRGRGRSGGGRRRVVTPGQMKQTIRDHDGRAFHSRACMRALLSPVRGPVPFPDVLRCVLTYSQSYTNVIANSAAVGRQIFSMNSLFDPDVTGTGAQPIYFDQLSTLYNRYRVYGSAIKVTLVPFINSTQNNVPVSVVLVPTAEIPTSTTLNGAAGLPRAQSRVQTGNMDYKTTNMVASHSIAEILGVKDVEGADRLSAQVSASPAEQAYWGVIAQTFDGLTAAYCHIQVRITYDVEFFDRVNQNESLLAKEEKKHLDDIKAELKGIEAYQKLHKTFEPVELKDVGSLRLPTLSNGEVHEKWLKLREADELARETPKTRPPSRK